jgi:hypothetical protein
MLQSKGRSAVVARDQTEQPHVRQTTRNLGQNIGLVRLDAVDSAEKADLPLPIEDYALIGDCTTAALVGRNGSIDWLCWPRFDSTACFAALLGTSEHGRWRICPVGPAARVRRSYRDGTMVLETLFETADGSVAVIDFMPIGQANSSVIRLVEGRRGKVAMRLHLTLRFDYGATVPWVSQLEDKSGLTATAGPSRVVLRAPLPLQGEDLATDLPFPLAQSRVMALRSRSSSACISANPSKTASIWCLNRGPVRYRQIISIFVCWPSPASRAADRASSDSRGSRPT